MKKDDGGTTGPSEIFLKMRDLIYCQFDLETALHAHREDDDLLREALDDILRDSAASAREKLERVPVPQSMWYWFVLARARQVCGDTEGARKALLQVARDADFEPRARVEAWSILRSCGYQPDAKEASGVLGVVAESAFNGGSWIVAGFADGDARIFWSSGGGMIGDMNAYPAIEHSARRLVAAAQAVVGALPASDAWPVPGKGKMSFCVLTPGGVRRQEMQEARMYRDPVLMPVFASLSELFGLLLDIFEKRQAHET